MRDKHNVAIIETFELSACTHEQNDSKFRNRDLHEIIFRNKGNGPISYMASYLWKKISKLSTSNKVQARLTKTWCVSK